MTPDERQWMEFLKQSIGSHDRQIGEITDSLGEIRDSIRSLTANVAKLVEVTNRDAVDIAALARVAEAHQKRLERLEGGRSE